MQPSYGSQPVGRKMRCEQTLHTQPEAPLLADVRPQKCGRFPWQTLERPGSEQETVFSSMIENAFSHVRKEQRIHASGEKKHTSKPFMFHKGVTWFKT